jgi:hypothetical protein
MEGLVPLARQQTRPPDGSQNIESLVTGTLTPPSWASLPAVKVATLALTSSVCSPLGQCSRSRLPKETNHVTKHPAFRYLVVSDAKECCACVADSLARRWHAEDLSPMGLGVGQTHNDMIPFSDDMLDSVAKIWECGCLM